jgi:hypothetical protein
MSASAVLTVRIDPELLDALREKARREGRTVSATVVHMVKREVTVVQPPGVRPSTMGMFSGFDAPDLHDLVQARRELSRSLRPRKRAADG